MAICGIFKLPILKKDTNHRKELSCERLHFAGLQFLPLVWCSIPLNSVSLPWSVIWPWFISSVPPPSLWTRYGNAGFRQFSGSSLCIRKTVSMSSSGTVWSSPKKGNACPEWKSSARNLKTLQSLSLFTAICSAGWQFWPEASTA